MNVVNIVGGGLAGSEAAYQLAVRGVNVRLYEMRPETMTPAHKSGALAELVCSNSFKSMAPHAAHAGFKRELSIMGSLIMKTAPLAQVPAGDTLAVDREVFSRFIEQALNDTGKITRISKLVESPAELPTADATIIATGPLTQGKLAEYLMQVTESSDFYFYDAIAPVVSKDSIDFSRVFEASRYGRGEPDYINCPFNKDEYDRFYDALMLAEKLDFKDFESAKYFQGCQPIEAIAATGRDTLRHGPMKPVGITDPKTGKRPYANVQLRIDNLSRSAYNMVGFQTKLKYGEQSKVFRLIPGLENAEFLRLGSMHRNTYICSPRALNRDFSLKKDETIYMAGQITGVEGYTESTCIGLLCAMSIWRKINGAKFLLPPVGTFTGALCRYLFECDPKDFQPQNVHYGLLPAIDHAQHKKQSKVEKRTHIAQEAVKEFDNWCQTTSFLV
jgi:methylenetetrahydrofolate--tRNA-(uracil-5-)-methyltransferase